MVTSDEIDWRNELFRESGKALSRKAYDAAIVAASRGYLKADEAGDQCWIDIFRSTLWLILRDMIELPVVREHIDADGTPLCSFCGRSEREVRVVLGAKAAICEYCAKTVVKGFETSQA